MRKINLSNEAKRDAEVAYGTTFSRRTPIYKTSDGNQGVSERSVKATMATTDEALLGEYGDGLADALINGDPEVDMERFGLKVEGLKKVYVTPGQKVAYGVTLNEHVYLPDGTMRHVGSGKYDFSVTIPTRDPMILKDEFLYVRFPL